MINLNTLKAALETAKQMQLEAAGHTCAVLGWLLTMWRREEAGEGEGKLTSECRKVGHTLNRLGASPEDDRMQEAPIFTAKFQ